MKKMINAVASLLAIVLVAQLVSACGGADQRKAKYLERGKSFLASENYDKAAIEFKNVLQIDPKYAEAYFLLGEAEEGRRDYKQAFGLYSKAVELNPDQFEAQVKLAQFYIMGGDLAKAQGQIKTVLAKQPNNTGALLVKAVIAAREGKDEEAIKLASEVIKIAPSESDAYNLLAEIYLKQKNPDKSIEILQQGITANSKNIPLRVYLAQIYASKKENDKAEKILQECVSLEPQKLQFRAMLASFLTKTNQLDKAEKVLRTAIEQEPKDADRRILLIEFLSKAKNDNKAAKQELLNGIKEIPDSSRLRFGLASVYVQTNDVPKAMDVYREIISRNDVKPEGLKARNLMAGLYLQQGKQDEAKKLTDEVLKENPGDNDALMIKARLLLAEHDAPGAIAALRTVLHDQPNLVEAYLYLADAYTLNKDIALAKETLMKAVELNPKSIKARMGLAQYYARSNDLRSADKTVDEALKLSPNDYGALGTKYNLLMAKKDIKGAQGILEKIITDYPDNPTGYYQLGQLYMSQHKYDAALREFNQASSKFKTSYQLMAAIVNVYLVEKKPEQALARLNDELAKEPSSRVFVHELMAEVYITQKKYNEAEKSLNKEIEANPTWNIPYVNLASISLIHEDFSSAEKVYQQGLKAIPDDPQLSMGLAGMYERNKNYDKAIATYERILDKQPGNDIAANNLASLLLDHSTDSKSLKRAKELAVRFESSTQPAFLDTLGWMYYRSGDMDKAIGVLEKVVKQAPAVGIFHYHLGMAYYKKNDNSSAKIQLTKALKAKSNFPGIDEAKATLKMIP
ncbi:MAG: tetratricopeptide repeat protein [Sulfuricaulis sp.]